MRVYQYLLELSVVFILLFTTPIHSNSQDRDNWVPYGWSENGKIISYDRTRVIHISPNVIKLWNKSELEEDEKTFIIERMKKNNLYHAGWDQLQDTVDLREVDCVNRTTKYILMIFRNAQGETIYEIDTQKQNTAEQVTNQIIPGSPNDILHNSVCKKK